MSGCTKRDFLSSPNFSFPQPENVTILEYIFLTYTRLDICTQTRVVFGDIDTVKGSVDAIYTRLLISQSPRNHDSDFEITEVGDKRKRDYWKKKKKKKFATNLF